MRRQRRTRIVATIGPASADPAVMEKLFIAGTDVFRINMSHTSHEAMRTYIDQIPRHRSQAQPSDRHSRRPAGAEAPPRHLQRGRRHARRRRRVHSRRRTRKPATSSAPTCRHYEVLAALEPGHRLLVNDGQIRLRVTDASKKRVITTVEVGGPRLRPEGREPSRFHRDGCPRSPKKTEPTLKPPLSKGVGLAWASFIQRPEDIAEARKLTRGRAAIMSKIEKPQAISKLSEIIELSDAADGGARRSRRRASAGARAGACRSRSPAVRARRESPSWSRRKCWNP